MKSVITFVVLVIIVLALALIGITDINTSIANTGILDSDVASNYAETDNSDSTGATITITMHTLPEEEWKQSDN